jgi:polyphosphate glucokinase
VSEAGQAFGVDIGGSGVKGGVVDLATGEMTHERLKIATPKPATPESVVKTVAELVGQSGWQGPVGITMPSVITGGVVRTAANIDKTWIGKDANALFSEALGGRQVTVLNDADAAGLAEDTYGAAKDYDGVVLLLTFGTGIGSALIYKGVLVPNTELGHMDVDGKEAEHRAAASIKDRDGLTYEQWTAEVSLVLSKYEALFWPTVFVAGGGISRECDTWAPLLTNRTPVVPAVLRNTAGIVGAAMAIDSGIKP